VRRSQLVTTVIARKNHFLQSQFVGCFGDAVVLVVWQIYMLRVVFGMVVWLLTFRVLEVFEVGVRVFEFWVLGFGFWVLVLVFGLDFA
jgi:hypothetical protein